MAYRIVHVVIFDGELIGQSSRAALPMVYETVALPWKLAARMAAAEERYSDDIYYVCRADDPHMRRLPLPASMDTWQEIPW